MPEHRPLLLVHATAAEIRVAHLDDEGRVQDLLVEQPSSAPLTGNVYLGRIRRVMPGMDAAFVDIGTDQSAYLPLSERGGFTPNSGVRISKGDGVVVQVGRDGFGGKGPRLTTRVQLPGRHLVLLASADSVSVAKRIEDTTERDRLLTIVKQALPAGRGAIVRTAARGVPAESLTTEIARLSASAARIEDRARSAAPPTTLWREPALAAREVRDHLGVSAAEVRVESSLEFLEQLRADSRAYGILDADVRIQRHDGDAPLFRVHGAERELIQALARVVQLDHGGTLAIDATEAATLVDVNTGRNVGRSHLEQTVLDTNLEAARALARQTRLRNLGGLILVDFIDMRPRAHQDQVLGALQEAFRGDSAPIRISGFTEMGMVEITRGRSRPTLAELLTESCPTCHGSGHIPRR